MKLQRKSVTKPWGQTALPKMFGGRQKEKTGEIWFQAPKGVTPALMTKYLFTSEKLSIQVHPDNRLARREGYPHGKDECWYIVEAEPKAVLGLGLTKEVSRTKLHAAVACGQLEPLIDWKPVKAGDFFYVPAGTIHAIGPGISLIEVQQNIDLTYRLYDYGRPRDLHLEQALEAATLTPYSADNHSAVDPGKTLQLRDGRHFRLFHVAGDDAGILGAIKAAEWQVIPLEGTVTVREKSIAPGECGLCTKLPEIDLSTNQRCLIATTVK